MSGAIVAFSSMAIAGRAISFELDTFEIMMYRSFIGVVIIVSFATAFGRWDEVTTRSLHIHAVRNLFHYTGQNLWFWSLTLIPLAQVFALEFTSPIWVTLLAPLILREKLTRTRALAALLGFIGILIVARPGATPLSPGVLAAAASAIGFAGSILFTKLLTRTERTLCILFWLTVMQSGFGIVMAGYDGDIALPSAQSVPWLVLIGIAGVVAHLCVTSALSVAPAAIVAPLDFARLPVIAVIGAVWYGESIDVFVLVGAAVIFGANYLNIWNERRGVTKQLQ
ncbi:MAG: DMT family transporter [Rhodobacteraceae bacterium]|nr:DMT family transporter [Paracoccaceae bacterium]